MNMQRLLIFVAEEYKQLLLLSNCYKVSEDNTILRSLTNYFVGFIGLIAL